MRLTCSEYRELNSILSEQIECFQIHGSFRKPHSFWIASKAVLEVANAPANLCRLIAAIRQWHDHMVVSLSDGVPMSGQTGGAIPIGLSDGFVNLGDLLLHP